MKPTKANISRVLNAAGFDKSIQFGGRHHFGNRITRVRISTGWYLADQSCDWFFVLKYRQNPDGEPKNVMLQKIQNALTNADMNVVQSQDGQELHIKKEAALKVVNNK